MKNDYCELTREQIHALPERFKGFLLSPFQLNLRNEFVGVPEDTFREMIAIIVEYASCATPPSPSTAPTAAIDCPECGFGAEHDPSCPRVKAPSTTQNPAREAMAKWDSMTDAKMPAPSTASAVGELPPLPKSVEKVAIHVRVCDDLPKYTKEGSAESWEDYYTADQMREYAQLALAAKTATEANGWQIERKLGVPDEPNTLTVRKNGVGLATLRMEGSEPRETVLYRYFDQLLSAGNHITTAQPSTGEVDVEAEREACEAWHGGIYRGIQADIAQAAWIAARRTQAEGARDAEQGGEDVRLRTADAIADHVADNWPMRKYSLDEIEARLRAIDASPSSQRCAK